MTFPRGLRPPGPPREAQPTPQPACVAVTVGFSVRNDVEPPAECARASALEAAVCKRASALEATAVARSGLCRRAIAECSPARAFGPCNIHVGARHAWSHVDNHICEVTLPPPRPSSLLPPPFSAHPFMLFCSSRLGVWGGAPRGWASVGVGRAAPFATALAGRVAPAAPRHRDRAHPLPRHRVEHRLAADHRFRRPHPLSVLGAMRGRERDERNERDEVVEDEFEADFSSLDEPGGAPRPSPMGRTRLRGRQVLQPIYI